MSNVSIKFYKIDATKEEVYNNHSKKICAKSFMNTKSKQKLKSRNLSSGLMHQQHLDHLQT